MVLSVQAESFLHPLDAAEQVVLSNDWAYDRAHDDELVAEMFTQWSDLRLWLTWRPDLDAMLFSCGFGSKIPKAMMPRIAELLMRANAQCWFGHFDYMEDEQLICFRHTLLMPEGIAPTIAMMEQMIDAGTKECERFYPALQSVIWAGESPENALQVALLDTVGEA